MPVVIETAAQDFPDAAQRFNWCNCQKEAPRLTSMLGQLTPQALTPTLGPVTPIFDFSFWENELTGGGGGLPTSQTGAPGSILPAAVQVAGAAASWLLPGVILLGAVWFLSSRSGGKRGRR